MSQQGETHNDDSKATAPPPAFVSPPELGQFENLMNDMPRVLEYYAKAAENAKQYAEKLSKSDPKFERIPDDRYYSRSDPALANALKVGLDAICKGQVAVITLAGGQASRLGADVPKGMYPLDLGFDKPIMNTLFYQQASQLKALLNLANEAGFPNSSIGWIIMTSTSTDERTRAFVNEVCNDVGFPSNNVYFIVQRDLPIYRLDGEFLLDSAEMMFAPNGNGGLYEALQPHLPRLRADGYKYFHAYCVDNILCYVADPVFIGSSIMFNADCAAKVVEKTDPEEKIGVIGMQPLHDDFENPKIADYIRQKAPYYVNKQIRVIEYSEMSSEQKAARHPASERLMFRAGNIANHFFTIDFLDVACEAELPVHRAEKKVRHREAGSTEYTTSTGVKLERFIFDVFPLAANFFVLEVDRNEEFSPLKNSNDIGTDCAVTCKNSLISRQKKWIELSGVDFNQLASLPEVASSISKEGIFLPTVAYFQSDLQDKALGRPSSLIGLFI
uniref:UDP-N-acetylglucosamine diphosphorylase n=1 Tax=Panagrellus redivivus TaxID=6233 RepID=A0A7E4UQQ4_PANRE